MQSDAGCQVGLRAGACGNGVVDPGESCDDGDQMDCDGCRGDCSARETGCGDRFVCGMEQCDDGNMTDGDGCSGLCTNEGIRVLACGDGILQAGEECDDGNVTAGDGCNSTCRTEATPLSSKKTICHQAEEKDQAKPGNDGRSCWKIK
ncbi:MAG: DUF4215 domain-containing protein [Deltaproteobacteria bacterium]|nr:DUF4215 domain-containing protein [Deltaproteobacteria bacterium]